MQIIPSAVQRLLVKLPSDTPGGHPFRAGTASGNAFRSVTAVAEDAGTFVGSGLSHPVDQNGHWHAVTPMAGARNLHPWDAAHELVRRTSADLGRKDIYAEPDFLQAPSHVDRKMTIEALVGNVCSESDFDPDWGPIVGLQFGWHLGDAFSQLKAARDHVGDPTGRRVRIAHLDTGYDPTHISLPKHLRTDMAWNFVDNNNSAVAPSHASGLFADPSHGTGTLGLLAGNAVPQFGNDYLGGAPFADIVPVRIGNTWLHLLTSALASGILHAVGWGCDIISMSAGGVPAQSWADAVNKAYDRGCCIFAASGDSKGGLPTHLTIYPARFKRVVSVCGVTHGGNRYFDDKFNLSSKTEGSWGPDSAMKTAISAYAPNVPWAKQGCSTMFDKDGSGTSAATPQAAAAGALWFQKHADLLAAAQPWQKVEAIRQALFQSAAKGDSTHLGAGTLRASNALDVQIDVASLKKMQEDTIDFALFKELFGSAGGAGTNALGLPPKTPVTDPRLHMLEVEASQLVLATPQLAYLVGDADVAKDRLTKQREKLIDTMRTSPSTSQTLKTFLNVVASKPAQRTSGARAEQTKHRGSPGS